MKKSDKAKILLGDADKLDFIEEESITAIITSPPYNLGKKAWQLGNKKRVGILAAQGIEYGVHSDNMDEESYQSWQLLCLHQWLGVCKTGGSLFYNHKNRIRGGRTISPLEWILESDWVFRQEIVWNRNSTHNHTPKYYWQHTERVYWLTKGNNPDLVSNIRIPDLWNITPCNKTHWHKAPFPPSLVRNCLLALPNNAGIVLDPFSGSGTTGKVALDMGFSFIGIDNDPECVHKSRAEIANLFALL